MVMVLGKKVWRTMKQHKSQYYGSAFLILISSMMFSLFLVAGINVQENLNEFRITHHVEDAHFVVQEPLQDLETLERQFGVSLEEKQYIDVFYDQDSVLRVLSEPEGINLYATVQGRALSQAGDVLLDPGFAKAHSLNVGDSIEVNGKTFTIRGFIALPDYIYPLKSEQDVLKNPDAFGIAVVSRQELAEINPPLTFYSIRMNGHSEADFKAHITASNAIIQWVDQAANNRISFVDGDIQGILILGRIMPVVLLLITMLLVTIVIWRLLKQEYTQIGTLYALGFRKGELLRQYLLYPIFVSLIGAIPGTAIGVMGIKTAVSLYSDFYNLPIMAIRLHWGIITLGLIIPFLFLVPATVVVVLVVLRKTPLELMRGSAGGTQVGWAERQIGLNRMPFRSKFQIRELLRSIPRALLMVLATAFASMLFLLGFVMKDSMDRLIEGNYQEAFKYEYQYTFRTFEASAPPGGEKMSLAGFTSERYHKGEKSFIIYGMQPDASLIRLWNGAGERLSFDQVIATKTLADQMGVGEGDTIRARNEWNAKIIDIQIDRIANTLIGDVIYMPIAEFNETNGLPDDSYLQLIASNKLDMDQSLLLSTLSKQDILNGYKELIKPLQAMNGMIAFAAFTIGLILIYVLISMTIEENRGKISMLKVLGYTKREVFRLVLGYNKWLMLMGYLLSIPLILLSLRQMFSAVASEMGIHFPVTVQWSNLVIVLGLVCATYFCSIWLNRNKIHAIPMEEALKSSRE
ncbi:ABC transporter permease [Paenibacillus tarimensis]